MSSQWHTVHNSALPPHVILKTTLRGRPGRTVWLSHIQFPNQESFYSQVSFAPKPPQLYPLIHTAFNFKQDSTEPFPLRYDVPRVLADDASFRNKKLIIITKPAPNNKTNKQRPSTGHGSLSCRRHDRPCSFEAGQEEEDSPAHAGTR